MLLDENTKHPQSPKAMEHKQHQHWSLTQQRRELHDKICLDHIT